eukprot:4132058-Alexandrium_andersonii.AAC.1
MLCKPSSLPFALLSSCFSLRRSQVAAPSLLAIALPSLRTLPAWAPCGTSRSIAHGQLAGQPAAGGWDV